ncbi:DMT family transporter [Motiliproteus coralliicola]|uniref:DMT family transporter n=1 Tax=Motiliproteus coralliicola TaxID=2283196 RepID=A0A369WR83_9GAMM|nr:DMT family transporter [Motiliproteus coralliicola]RDE24177.1 DMT family transporter [Motiliproteus coralliicola]
MKTALYTLIALLAFAGNSILCRLALGDEAIDAASFTIIRLLAGIVTLLVILKLTRGGDPSPSKGSWKAAGYLFLYAITFSYAYVSIETGVGALILFCAVQITMILVQLINGKRLIALEWLGVLVAFGGLVYLLLPGAQAPSFSGFVLMAIAGVAWGGYTLAGRGSANPLADTSYNFLRTLPLVVALLLVSLQQAELSQRGILLAVMSGAVASGIGYTIWYMALGGLSAVQAAVLQLIVPVIAAIGGVIFADEPLSLRLVLSGLLILGGILVVILGRYHHDQQALSRS